jgi:hypothetical protein
VCALTKDFSEEQDFPEQNLFQIASRTPEDLLSGTAFLGVASPAETPERKAPMEF